MLVSFASIDCLRNIIILVPVADVAGTGVFANAVPPVAASYHFNKVPVAAIGAASAFWQ